MKAAFAKQLEEVERKKDEEIRHKDEEIKRLKASIE